MSLEELKKYPKVTTSTFTPIRRSNRRSKSFINIMVEQMSESKSTLQRLEQQKAESLTLECAISDQKINSIPK